MSGPQIKPIDTGLSKPASPVHPVTEFSKSSSNHLPFPIIDSRLSKQSGSGYPVLQSYHPPPQELPLDLTTTATSHSTVNAVKRPLNHVPLTLI